MKSASVQRILITGAASGIGRDSALALARSGHTVIATDKSMELLSSVQKHAQQEELDIQFAKLDLDSHTDIEQASKYDIDVLVNNGAIGQTGALSEIPMDRVRANFETNVFGTIALTQVMAKKMIKRKSGRVIIVGSTGGLITLPFYGTYNMTKYALEAATDTLRVELSEFNIHVSLIEPGKIDTGFNQRMAATKLEWMNERSLFGFMLDRLRSFDETFFRDEYPTTPVVKDIQHAIEAKSPKSRYVSPRRMVPIMWVARNVSSRIKDMFFKRKLS